MQETVFHCLAIDDKGNSKSSSYTKCLKYMFVSVFLNCTESKPKLMFKCKVKKEPSSVWIKE